MTMTAYDNLTLKRSQEGKYTISTIEDTNGIQETAIYKNRNKIVIVQRYASRDAARAGHDLWAAFCRDKPRSAYDVTYNQRLAL